MKFLVDAQLARWLVRELVDLGPDAIHTLELTEDVVISHARRDA